LKFTPLWLLLLTLTGPSATSGCGGRAGNCCGLAVGSAFEVVVTAPASEDTGRRSCQETADGGWLVAGDSLTMEVHGTHYNEDFDCYDPTDVRLTSASNAFLADGVGTAFGGGGRLWVEGYPSTIFCATNSISSWVLGIAGKGCPNLRSSREGVEVRLLLPRLQPYEVCGELWVATLRPVSN